jgi:hypothetical protein
MFDPAVVFCRRFAITQMEDRYVNSKTNAFAILTRALRQIWTLPLIVAGAAQTAAASTIVAIPGPALENFEIGAGTETLAQSWQQTSEATDVQITALLWSNGTSASTVTAYLTTDIGPASSAADMIAESSVSILGGSTSAILFTGLDLPGGTYYLVLSGAEVDDTWSVGDLASMSLGTGDSLSGTYYSSGAGIPSITQDTFYPFVEPGQGALMSVTGTPVVTTATPEPSSTTLAFVAILALWCKSRTSASFGAFPKRKNN